MLPSGLGLGTERLLCRQVFLPLMLHLLLLKVASFGTKCGKHWVHFKISFSSVCFSGFQGTTITMVEGLLVVLWVGSIHDEGWFAPAVL